MRKSSYLAAEDAPTISHTIAEEVPVHRAGVCDQQLSPPGYYDKSSRLTIPQTLFGRESELAALESSVEGLIGGESSLLLVSGPSGCGKSSLIALGLQRLALSGKVHVAAASYELAPQASPHGALRQALTAAVRLILAEDDHAIGRWRQRLNESLGSNGQVMVDLIPELGWLIGPQPAPAELAPEAHRNRFLFTLGHFVAALAPPDHPLILVLDNLHWADAGSLELLAAIAGDPQPRALLLIGAYRTDPVSSAGTDSDALPARLATLEETGMSVQHLALTPLPLCATNGLVAALLNDDPHATLSLAERIQSYTLGNPFFVVELMQALVNAGAIGRATPEAGWRWDLAAVDRLDLGDDVAELLAGALRRLSEATQRLLTVGALLGSSFDLDTLARVQQAPVEEVAADLQPALQAGLLVPLDSPLPMVRFRHDRIQEAAQAGLTGEARQALHLRVGQTLLPTLTSAEEAQEEDDGRPGRERFLHAGADYLPDGPLYRAVHHLNAAVDLIIAPDERRQLAELNLQAGRQARSAAAFDAAWAYCHQGLTLLAAGEMWTNAYDLALGLHVEGAEAAYLSAHHEAVEPLASQATAHARDATDRARAYQVWIQAAIARNELDQAMDLTIVALAQLGIRLPADRLRLRSDLRKLPGAAEKPVSVHGAQDEAPTDNARSLITILGSLARTRWALRGRRIEDLAELPPVTDPSLRIAGSIMASIGQSLQMQGSPHRIALITLEAMRLSLRHGLFPTSAVGYAAYGAILCMLDTVPGLGDIDTAYRMGQLAMRLADRPEVQPYRARITVPVQYLVNHRRVHHRESLAPLLAGYQAGLESGDPEGAALCALCYVSHAYQLGLPLVELEHQIADFAAVVAQLRQRAAELALAFNHQTVLNLLGRADDPLRLTGERCDEEAAQAELEQSGSSGTLTAFLVLKAYLAYVFHDTDAALALADQMQPHISAIAGFLAYGRCLALDALIRLDRCHQAGSAERRRLVRQAQADLRRLQTWAKQAPMNHLHDVRLVEAELAWVQGRPTEAAAHYAAAIRLCQEHGWASDAPLAAERAARFYLACGQTEQARDHLRLARAGYVRWGALAIVQHFDRVYADWLPKPAIPSSLLSEPPSTAAGIERVAAPPPHFSAVFKAAHAVASEGELALQVQRLMAILLEHTGARRGVLLIPDFAADPAGETVASLRVEADCLAGGPCHVLQAQPLLDQDPEVAAAPRRVVNFVVHSRQSLALPDVAGEPPFAADPAVLARQVSSLLCLPLRQQRQLIGVLYLENLPDPDAFTTQEGEVLSLLATQAALSVQNARLREGGRRRVEGGGWRVESGERGAKEASGVLRVAPVALAVLVGDDEMAAPEGAGEAERWAAAWMRQARLHLREGHWTEANVQVDEALALAEQAGDRAAWRPIALGFGPELAVLPGGLRRCQVIAQQAGALIPAGDDDWQMGLLAQQATAAWLSGRLSEALAAYRQALALVPPTTGRWTAAPSDLLGLAASVHTARRDYDQAQQTLDSLATHLRRAGLGETREVGWLFRQARLDWLRGTAAASGSVASALRFLEARANHPWAPVLLPVLQGLAAMVEGQPEIAERYLREAAGREEAIPSVAMLVRPSLLLANVLFLQGATEAALDVVTPVLDACRRAHTAGLIVQESTAVIPVLRLAAQQGRGGPMAAHVLSLLGVSNVARRLLLPETGIVLSPREVDVLEMLAANATNRAIAERMDVDMTTVKSHVTRVLAKLGVRTRYEAAERARELGLGNGS